MASPNMQLMRLKKQTATFLEKLQESYPHKDSSEYTRLVEDLEAFLEHADWNPSEEE